MYIYIYIYIHLHIFIQLYNYILTIGGSLDVPVPERSDLGKKRGFISKGERPL